MKIIKITKRTGRKIGNSKTFSSVTFETESTVTVNDGETPEDAEQALWEFNVRCLDKDIKRWQELRRKVQVEKKASEEHD